MPKSNTALKKFTQETPQSIERKQAMELVANEFNDARSQVIKRLFDQSAVYAELFDKQRSIGNTVIAYSLGKELGLFKDSIEKAKVKLEENEKKPFDDIFGSYSKLINAVNAYVNSTGSRSGDVAGITTEIRGTADSLNQLFLEGIARMEKVSLGRIKIPKAESSTKSGKVDLLLPKPSEITTEETPKITDNDLMNLFLLYEKIQSGYAEGQQLLGINLAGILSVSESERKRIKEVLEIGKELVRGTNMTPEQRRKISDELDNARRVYDEIQRTGKLPPTKRLPAGLSESSTTRYPKLPAELADPTSQDFFQVPAKQDGEFVRQPARPNREGRVLFPSPLGREGIDFNVPPPPPYSPLGYDFNADQQFDFNVGQGKARGGRKGVNETMARNYELIRNWSGFPHTVPPAHPPVRSVNPRSRVNNRTEANGMPSGSGKKKGKKSGKPKYNDI